MSVITTTADLRARYKLATGRSVEKVLKILDQHCQHFISLSPFLVISSSSDEGAADCSPRGEYPGFVQIIDDKHIAIPDRPGNNRLDTFENIIRNPNVGMIFFIPGVDETLRINGCAEIRDDADLLGQFEVNGKLPLTVLVVTIDEVYLHCAKALMRSNLWNTDVQINRQELPTMGQMISDQIGASEKLTESHDEMKKRYLSKLY